MFRFIIAMTIVLGLCSQSFAAVLVFNNDGKYTTKPSLNAASTAADCAGKRIVVTTPQTLSADMVWPADRTLDFEPGGYINKNGHAFTYASPPQIIYDWWFSGGGPYSGGSTTPIFANFSGQGLKTTDIIAKGPWVDVRSSNLATAAAYAIANNKPLHITETVDITTATDISEVPEVDVIAGGGFTSSNGSSLVLPKNFHAGVVRVFFGDLVVTGLKEAHPQWWGAIADGNSHPATVATNPLRTFRIPFYELGHDALTVKKIYIPHTAKNGSAIQASDFTITYTSGNSDTGTTTNFTVDVQANQTVITLADAGILSGHVDYQADTYNAGVESDVVGLQKAIDAVSGAVTTYAADLGQKGGQVILGGGKYLVNQTPFSQYPYVQIAGVSRNATALQATAAIPSVLWVGGISNAATIATRAHIHDFTVDANSLARNGLTTDGMSWSTVEHLYVTGALDGGLNFINNTMQSRFADIECRYNRVGLLMYLDCSQNHFDTLRLAYNYQYAGYGGERTYISYSSHWDNCIIEFNNYSVYTTGTGTIGTDSLTVASSTFLAPGQQISVAGAGVYTIDSIDGTTVTLTGNLTASVSGANVSYYGGGIWLNGWNSMEIGGGTYFEKNGLATAASDVTAAPPFGLKISGQSSQIYSSNIKLGPISFNDHYASLVTAYIRDADINVRFYNYSLTFGGTLPAYYMYMSGYNAARDNVRMQGSLALVAQEFFASRAYQLNEWTISTSANSDVTKRAVAYKCTTAGTSDSSEPAWDTTLGNTTTSGTAVFTAVALPGLSSGGAPQNASVFGINAGAKVDYGSRTFNLWNPQVGAQYGQVYFQDHTGALIFSVEDQGSYNIINAKSNVNMNNKNITSIVEMLFTPVATTTATNGGIFVDSADNVLKFKDSGGVVHALY